MVIIGEIDAPSESLIYFSNDVVLRINQKTFNTGSLYITKSALCWKPDGRNDGISIPWNKVTLHATQMEPIKSVFVMLDFSLSWPGTYESGDGDVNNGNGVDHHSSDAADDDDEEGDDNDAGEINEEADAEMTQMWLQPKDTNTIEQIFSAMKHCQSLNPDPNESLSEEDDFMATEDDENEQFDDVGQESMDNLQIDDDKFADAEE